MSLWLGAGASDETVKPLDNSDLKSTSRSAGDKIELRLRQPSQIVSQLSINVMGYIDGSRGTGLSKGDFVLRYSSLSPDVVSLRGWWNHLAAIAITATALLVAACNTVPTPVPLATSVSAPAVSVPAAQLPGNWGLASYHNTADLERTIEQARIACANPYQIGRGASGGIVMHLADQTQPSELFVKTDSAGRSFIGPTGEPGMIEDRVVMFFDDGVMITKWLDPSAGERFGTLVFVRCA